MVKVKILNFDGTTSEIPIVIDNKIKEDKSTMVIVKKAKRCPCGKVIASHNKSGLCRSCWKKKDNKKKWRERVKI